MLRRFSLIAVLFATSFLALPLAQTEKLDYAAITDGNAGKRVGATLLRSLHQINRALGRATIMDSVGSREILRELAAAGVDYAQGTAVGQPVPLRRRRARSGSANTGH